MFIFKYVFMLSLIYAEKTVLIQYIKIMKALAFAINIGEPCQKAYLEIDLTIDYTWVTDFCYNPKNSDTVIMNSNYSIEGTECKLIRDKILFGEGNDKKYQIDDFAVVNMPFDALRESEAIGLGFKGKNNIGSNIVYAMYSNGLIERRNFAFVPYTLHNGDLYFGGIPQSVIEKNKLKYKVEAKVNEEFDTWNVNISHIVFTNGTNVISVYENEYYSYFITKKKEIYAPIKFMMYVKDNVMKEFYEKGICLGYALDSNRDFICHNEIVKMFPNISFVIENKMFVFTAEDMFIREGGYSYMNLMTNNDDVNQFIIGSDFMMKYITQFDYDKKSIVFYSNTELDDFRVINIKGIKIIYTIVIIMLIITLLFNIFINKD